MRQAPTIQARSHQCLVLSYKLTVRAGLEVNDGNRSRSLALALPIVKYKLNQSNQNAIGAGLARTKLQSPLIWFRSQCAHVPLFQSCMDISREETGPNRKTTEAPFSTPSHYGDFDRVDSIQIDSHQELRLW